MGDDYTTAYSHDTAGRPNRVWHHPELDTNGLPQGAPDFTYGYLTNAPHLIETVTGPAHTVTRIPDPARDVLKQIENRKLDSTLVSAYEYTVNAIGQRKQVLTTGTAFNGAFADWDWDYDPMGQLTTAEASASANSRAYQYDAIGNRLISEVSNHEISDPPVAATATYTSNPLNQYESISGGGFQPPGPTYDLDGNETSGPVPGAAGNTPGVQPPAHATDLQWDAENRLISATIGTDTITYRYDHLSRLVVRKLNNTITHRYFYDGWNRIAEYNGAGALQDTFTWGLDLSGTMQGAGGVGGLLATRWVSSTNSPAYYPTYDGNGNVSEYLDGNGAPVAHYEYDPFGNLTRQTGSSDIRFQYRFSTKPRDPDTGLYYYGYRLYNALTGRWPSTDPIEEEGGVNLYAIGSNIVAGWDVLGEWWVSGVRTKPGKLLNAVVTDGKGGLRPYVKAKDMDEKCCLECLYEHERIHIEDMLKANPNLGKDKNGKPFGHEMIVLFSTYEELYVSELRAHAKEGECLEKAKLVARPDCKKWIELRIQSNNMLINHYNKEKARLAKLRKDHNNNPSSPDPNLNPEGPNEKFPALNHDP